MEDIAATEAVGGALTQQKPMSLDDVSTRSATSVERENLMLSGAERAMGRILSRDLAANIEPQFPDELSGLGAREIADEKAELVSTASRSTGANQADGDAPSTDWSSTMVDRFSAIYEEVTIYHVGWTIANRTQKSVEQLLRGQ